jgi:hypothetical protein
MLSSVRIEDLGITTSNDNPDETVINLESCSLSAK